MIIKFPLCAFGILLSLSALSCELPRGEVIKIGCSYDCSFFYRFRISMTAWVMNYKVSFVDLQTKNNFKQGMSEVDAVLVPGGADIDPKYYLPAVTPELRDYTQKNIHLFNASREGSKRDPFEYELIKTYSNDDDYKDLPLLGICRGLQMMSVAQGIPLYLDIKNELGIKNRYNKVDRVYIDRDSVMDSIYRPDSVRGFKYHHQGIRLPYFEQHSSKYPLTKVTAYSNSRNIAEAIEYTHRPALGVQFHPEKSFTSTSAPIFRWFLTKACEYKTSKDSI